MAKSQVERVKSSLVLRLNGRFFLRLLGIFLWMNVVLALLVGAWFIHWADGLCNDVALLVEQRGIPGPEATMWMNAGDYQVEAVSSPTQGQGLEEGFLFRDGVRRSLVPPSYYRQERTTAQGDVYAIRLDISAQMHGLRLAGGMLLLWQGLALLLSLFRTAGILKRTLRPIQELAAAASKLGNMSALSPTELRDLAGKLDEVNSTHLDRRIHVAGAQQEMTALTDAINAMLDRIDRAYQSQARFVSDASHELRTPIAVVRGYADMLDRWGKNDPAAAQEAIDAIKSEATSMQNLVEQLLFLARGDNNTTPLRPEPFDLTAVASQLIKEAQMIDGTHGFEGRWEDTVPVIADLGLMKQAARILLDNAMKYSPPQGRILVTVGLHNGRAALSVEDEGQGIPAGDIPHVFERFYRTDQSRARQTGGTGLGLAIAKWIVDRHGGTIEVISRENVGTRFTLLLPVQGEHKSPGQ